MMLKVVGTKTTTVIFMGDIWKPKALWDSRYLWMPLETATVSCGFLSRRGGPWML